MDWQQKFIHIVHIDVCKITYLYSANSKKICSEIWAFKITTYLSKDLLLNFTED